MSDHIPQRTVILQERDFELLGGLFESRLLTLRHLAMLYFGGRSEAAKKRVQKLKDAGYVAERPRLLYAPSVLYLAKEGFLELQRGGYLDRYPRIGWTAMERRASVSPATLRHELEVADVKAAILSRAHRRGDIFVSEFSTWPALTQFHVRIEKFGPPALVKPDGFLRLKAHTSTGIQTHSFFIELDRSTEVLQTLVTKALCYSTYYRSGGFAVRCNADLSAYREYPFRVLLICKSAARRDSAAMRLLHNDPPILSQVWLSTLQEVIASPFGAVWARPIDYRHVKTNENFVVPTSNLAKYPLLMRNDSSMKQKTAVSNEIATTAAQDLGSED